jgi:hypothetical protein
VVFDDAGATENRKHAHVKNKVVTAMQSTTDPARIRGAQRGLETPLALIATIAVSTAATAMYGTDEYLLSRAKLIDKPSQKPFRKSGLSTSATHLQVKNNIPATRAVSV